MDPLSIAASAGTLSITVGRLIKLLHRLHGTVKDAPLILTSITTECTVVHASLCTLQDLQAKRARQPIRNSGNVLEALELSLLNCAQILSVLEKDAQSCLEASKSPSDDAVKKIKYLLSKDHLQVLLLQLRGQQQALTLLLSTLQRYAAPKPSSCCGCSSLCSRSLDEMNGHLQDNRDILHGLARQAAHLHFEVDGLSVSSQCMDGRESLTDIKTYNSSTRFAFDQEVLSSRIYQRQLTYLQKLQSRQAELKSGHETKAEASQSIHITDAVTGPGTTSEAFLTSEDSSESPETVERTQGRDQPALADIGTAEEYTSINEIHDVPADSVGRNASSITVDKPFEISHSIVTKTPRVFDPLLFRRKILSQAAGDTTNKLNPDQKSHHYYHSGEECVEGTICFHSTRSWEKHASELCQAALEDDPIGTLLYAIACYYRRGVPRRPARSQSFAAKGSGCGPRADVTS
jgi:hypothetical protein